ncbi:HD domain-containing protein [Peribacillus glennii]|uniref:HD domain-containing protein n=1 Tax=Peribacillus glennii TaxID=2303991 RepID=A0A372LHK0_9BACI|nr:HD domain-containing protein [Peribacillus glennii]RFU65464.1 HD domain-containing protein [Peribacillus glennii]
MNQFYIDMAQAFVKKQLGYDTSGHDWYHIDRVRKLSLRLARTENQGDLFVIEMAALLHDIPDSKLHQSEDEGWQILREWFSEIKLPEETEKAVTDIISTISFSAFIDELPSIEAKIVQDADRLDAIGAIGIARTFAYGGKKGQAIYDPDIEARKNMTKQDYRSGKSSSIHHFYEKLLKLKGMLHTKTAKKMAAERHEYMEIFLQQFYKEWDVTE